MIHVSSNKEIISQDKEKISRNNEIVKVIITRYKVVIKR